MNRMIAFILFTLLLFGCSQAAPSAPHFAIESESQDPQSGATIRTQIQSSTIGIADRLEIILTTIHPESVSMTLVDPDWDASGWSLIEFYSPPPLADGSEFVTRYTFLLEPFLAGDYTTPKFEFRVLPRSDSPAYSFFSMPHNVTVATSLGEQDAGELAPPPGVFVPQLDDSREERLAPFLIAGLAATIALIAFVLWKTLRRKTVTKGNSVYEDLLLVSRTNKVDDIQSFDRFHNALSRLDTRLQSTPEFQLLQSHCDLARFSRGLPVEHTPADLARQALSLLGFDEEGEQ